MPINPTTLKALIDTQITNETVNFAITPTEVGSRMKDTIDYTTEQISGIAATPDATTSVKGKIQLAGDLAGTADLPTVPQLTNKENLSNKSTDVVADGLSNTKYPSVKAVKDYADGIVVGLLDDRGNYDASSNLFPATGGSGVAGAVLKGDLWYISVTGTLGGVSVPVGASVRALVDAPAQTSTNWSILNVGLGFTPENVVNKSTDVTTDAASDTKYPSVKAIKDYVDANLGTPEYTEGSLNTNSYSIAGNPATTTGKIIKNFTRAYVTSSTNKYIGLSNIGKDTGDFYVVQNKSTTLDLVVIPIDGTEFLQPNGFSSQVEFTVKANTYARFTLADNDSGSAKTFMVEVINPLGAGQTIQQTIGDISATNSSYPTLTNDINNIIGTYDGHVLLPVTTQVGKQVIVISSSIGFYVDVSNVSTMSIAPFRMAEVVTSYRIPDATMFKFTYVDNGKWIAERLSDSSIKLDGFPLSFFSVENNINLTFYSADTSLPSLSTLNSNYAFYPNGFRIFYPNMSGGAIMITKLYSGIFYRTTLGTQIT
jgi:hypothetical protein